MSPACVGDCGTECGGCSPGETVRPDPAAVSAAGLARLLVEALSDSVALFAPDGTLLMANAACRDLFGRDLPAGSRPADLLTADDPLLPCLGQALGGGHRVSHDLQRRAVSGQPHWLRLGSTVLTAADGSPVGTLVVCRDVPEPRRVEADVPQEERMGALGRLSASVAHEVRNPLGAIGIQLQLLEEDIAAAGGPLVEGARRRLSIARTEMRRLDNIVQSFLRFSRPPALNLRHIDPGEFLGRIFALVEPEARERRLHLGLEVAADLPAVEADEDQLSQALLNLLINAFQASPAGAEIDVSCRPAGDEVVLSIQDHGQGIPASDLERIFELYFTTRDEGTGLGLPIAQRIIHQHGGVLAIESAEGRGTQVSVRLPAAGPARARA
jgi:signal transduction histidine kinase